MKAMRGRIALQTPKAFARAHLRAKHGSAFLASRQLSECDASRAIAAHCALRSSASPRLRGED
jgi:hypothetical protein